MSDLVIEVIPKNHLSAEDNSAIIKLCSAAFEEDYRPYLETFGDSVHILARQEGVLVSHALWVTRWLQVDEDLLLRTAYVEGVATAASYRGQGLATVVMERLVSEIGTYEIAALSPADTTLYARLGWEFWQGPLFTRTADALIADPDEVVMIFRLPKTPDLDMTLPISVEWREGEVW